jgi:type I restriction enzyme M protein
LTICENVLDTFYMTTENDSAREFLLKTIDCIKATSVSKFEALHIGLELLAWAKLSHTLALPKEFHIATTGDYALERIQSFFKAAWVQFPGAFTTLIKLEAFNVKTARSLMHEAETLASNGSLDFPSIEDLMPPLSIGADNSLVIPTELTQLIISLGGLTPSTTVYVPWDFLGGLSTKASVAGAASVYLESPMQSGVPLLIKILTASNVEVHYANPIIEPSAIEDGRLRKFDVSLAFPPIGARYDKGDPDQFKRFPEKTNSGSILSLRHLLSQTRSRVVVVVPNTLLFSIGAEKTFREDLLRKGIIRSVIAMPDGLLENVSSGIAVMILEPTGEHQCVRFVNASSEHFYDRISKTRTRLKNVCEISRLALLDSIEPDSVNAVTVPTTNLIGLQSNLQVNQYVMSASKKLALQYLENARTIALKDLVHTVRPLSLNSLKTLSEKSASTFEAIEVGALDLPAFGFISRPRRRIELPASMINEHSGQFLRPNDIVLIVKGGVGKVGIVPDTVPNGGPEGWIVGQSAIILRSTRFPPRALFVFLRSALGQALLKGVVSGATTPLIQLGQLLSLQIPRINEEEQQRAIDALMRECEIQSELERLHDEQAKIATTLWSLE